MQTGEEARCFLHAMIGALDAVPAYPKAPAHHAATLASYDALWARGIKVPVRTLCDLARLDEAQVVAGRRLAENPDSREPGRRHSRAFWHGWRSRRMELSPNDRDEAHCELYFRFWWWVLRHRPDSLRIVSGYAPDSDIAQPGQYADLERALECGEPV